MALWPDPDATTTAKGIVQLAGDLGGTAASPTVPGLTGKAATSHTHAESDVTSLVADLAAKAMGLTATAVKTANYPAVAGDLVRGDTSSGTFTVTLPASTVGAVIGLKKTDSSATALTFATTGGDTVDGVSSGSLTLANQSRIFLGVAGGWTVPFGLNTLASLDARYALDSTLTTKGDIYVATAASTPARLAVGANNTVPVADSSQTTGWKWASPPIDFQIFTANGTWTRPTATTTTVTAIGGGGGGGAGRRSTSGVLSTGGGGGGGGAMTVQQFRTADLSATEAVAVGAFGAGATGQVSDSTNGASGSTGGISSFGSTKVRATGGFFGGGGLSTGASAAGGGGSGTFAGNGGAASSGSGAAGFTGTGGSTAGASGGGSGGGVATTPANTAGGAGGAPNTNNQSTAGIAGTSGGGNGGNATASADLNTAYVGAAGGGGGSSTSAAGGNGGNASVYGGGGGGGGASLNGNTSGAGGNGANGIVIAVSI